MRKTTKFIWVRLGDADNYNRFDDVAEAAEHMSLFGIRHVHRSQKYGVEAEGLSGQNYISLFYGDDDAQPTRELSGRDVRLVNECLLKGERQLQKPSTPNTSSPLPTSSSVKASPICPARATSHSSRGVHVSAVAPDLAATEKRQMATTRPRKKSRPTTAFVSTASISLSTASLTTGPCRGSSKADD